MLKNLFSFSEDQNNFKFFRVIFLGLLYISIAVNLAGDLKNVHIDTLL